MIAKRKKTRPSYRPSASRLESKIQRAVDEIKAEIKAEIAADQPLVVLRTVEDVIENVYGTGTNLARRFDLSLPTIADWRRQETFATNTYKAMIEDLAAAGFTAPASLWKMKE